MTDASTCTDVLINSQVYHNAGRRCIRNGVLILSRRVCLLGCNNCAEGPNRWWCARLFAEVRPEPSLELRLSCKDWSALMTTHTRIARTHLNDEDDAENIMMQRTGFKALQIHNRNEIVCSLLHQEYLGMATFGMCFSNATAVPRLMHRAK